MPVELRPPRPDDVAGLLALDPPPAARVDDKRSRHLADLIRAAANPEDLARPRCLVADQAERLAGYVLVRPRHLRGLDFVERLAVDGRRRRQGIGLALLRAAAAGAGLSQVWTSTPQSNLAARGMLAGDGWRSSGRLTGLAPGHPEEPEHPELFFHRQGDREGRPGVLFHAAFRQDWERAVREGAYRVSTLGATLAEVGFIHLSFGHQVAAMSRRLYAGERRPMVLLEVARARLTPPVRLEPGEDEMYPHLFGPLDQAAVVDVHPLGRDSGGRLLLPPLA